MFGKRLLSRSQNRYLGFLKRLVQIPPRARGLQKENYQQAHKGPGQRLQHPRKGQVAILMVDLS